MSERSSTEGLFLSYRRDDTAADAKRIYDRLAERFGEELVFLDVEDIPLGEDFVDRIARALERAAYVLIAIGPRWLLVADENGRRRLDDPGDMVRHEVRTALGGKKRVVPLLMGGARMPRERELPHDIAPLVRRNGIAIRPEPDFEADVVELMRGLHVDRVEMSRVPTVFRVGHVARNLGLGGGVGWGLLGVVGAMLSNGQHAAWLVLPASGFFSGFTGGAFVGWLTGFLIRHRSPPLVGRQLVRMGILWSLGLVLTAVVAGGVGYFLGLPLLDVTPPETDGFLEAIGAMILAAILGIVLFAIAMVMVILVGFVTGSVVAAAFVARQFRLRSDQISGGRALAIALVWLAGALLTGALFLVAVGLSTPG